MAIAGYIIAIFAYLLMGTSQLVDKAYLNNVFRDSRAFTCFVGLMNVLALLVLPFGIIAQPSSALVLLLALLFGAAFIIALLPFFAALQGDDASRVIPVVGGLTPVFVFLVERFAYHSHFNDKELMAFALLVAGSFIMMVSHKHGRKSLRSLWLSTVAAGLFALSFAGSKLIFDRMGLVDGFFWMRMGGLVVGLFLLSSSDLRRELQTFFKKRPLVVGAYLANQGIAAVGFVLQSYAIAISRVSIVSALQGAQYAVVLLFALLASILYPRFIQEEMTPSIVVQKSAAVVTICAGLALLFL